MLSRTGLPVNGGDVAAFFGTPGRSRCERRSGSGTVSLGRAGSDGASRRRSRWQHRWVRRDQRVSAVRAESCAGLNRPQHNRRESVAWFWKRSEVARGRAATGGVLSPVAMVTSVAGAFARIIRGCSLTIERLQRTTRGISPTDRVRLPPAPRRVARGSVHRDAEDGAEGEEGAVRKCASSETVQRGTSHEGSRSDDEGARKRVSDGRRRLGIETFEGAPGHRESRI